MQNEANVKQPDKIVGFGCVERLKKAHRAEVAYLKREIINGALRMPGALESRRTGNSP